MITLRELNRSGMKNKHLEDDYFRKVFGFIKTLYFYKKLVIINKKQ